MVPDEIIPDMGPLVFERDRQEFALGDTLDIKTGLLLTAMIFLAIQSGELIKTCISFAQWKAQMVAFLTGHATPAIAWGTTIQWSIQMISISALLAGGAAAIATLKPRNYDREAPPKEYLDWINSTEAYRQDYPETQTEPITGQKLTAIRIAEAIENVQTNLAVNKKKSALMELAFIFMAVSFGANIFTLAMRLL